MPYKKISEKKAADKRNWLLKRSSLSVMAYEKVRYAKRRHERNKSADWGAFEISKEWFISEYKRLKGSCAVTGVRFNLEDKALRPSIDRIDNKRGYELSNVQLVTYAFNVAKHERSMEFFLTYIVMPLQRNMPNK